MKLATIYCAIAALTIPTSTLAKKFNREQSRQQIEQAVEQRKAAITDELRREWDAKAFTTTTPEGDFTMPIWDTVYGAKPDGGRSLYISLHGGGGGPAEMNDGQWSNQKKLYRPAEGVYVAPRSPTNSWNMWHQGYMDELIAKTIASAVLFEGVNPDRVYLMGYSAGGDGLYQLAPRLADKLAAGAMMAGHPGDASPLPLRNLPFAIYMGGQDAAYERNSLAREWGTKLDMLQTGDAGGYTHQTHVWEDCGHWMLRRDTIAVPWMAQFDRLTYPDKVVWVQDDILRPSFYWLSTPEIGRKQGDKVVASIKGQNIDISECTAPRVILGLNDRMIDLDRPITITFKGEKIATRRFHRHPPQYLDPSPYSLENPYPVILEVDSQRVTRR